MRMSLQIDKVDDKVRRARGFTLLEVLLAVVIAIGLLGVALYFYQQAAEFRAQIITETEKVSAARLLMDRITTELRTARRHAFYEQAFIGESDFLQFIKTDVPSRAAWSGGALGRAAAAETDLKLVRYGLSISQVSTNQSVAGLKRTEEPLVDTKIVESSASVVPAGETNASPALLTDAFRYLRFRYWDGTEWIASWSKPGIPRGVEITIGSEPVPSAESGSASATRPGITSASAASSQYPYEVFRRVVYLPGSSTENAALVFAPSSTNTAVLK